MTLKQAIPRGMTFLLAGTALALMWLVFGAAGAHADDGGSHSKSHGLLTTLSATLDKALPAPPSTQTPLSGAVSGLLDPAAGLVDDTIAKMPVVGSIVGPAPVTAATKPVVDVVRHVEATVSSAPVAGPVVSSVTVPASGVVSTVVTPVVTPVVSAVEKVTTPVLDTVTTVTKPVTKPVTDGVKPIVDPVVEVIAPVVDGVLGNGGGSAGSEPVDPGGAGTPQTSGVVPHAAGVTASSTAKHTPATHSAAARNGTAVTSSHVATNTATSWLGRYRTADAIHAVAGAGRDTPANGAPTAGQPFQPGISASCAAVDPANTVVCLSAVSAAPTGSSSGGSTGGAGSGSADEFFPFTLTAGTSGNSVRDVAWSLPASMPANPGSSPD